MTNDPQSSEDLQLIIDRRNRRLVALISKLKLGIHILNFPEKPMFYSSDYTTEFSGYVKNFDIILKTQPFDGEIFLEIKLDQQTSDDDQAIERLCYIFLDWMNTAKHKRCYVVKVRGTNLMLSGYNHHDRLNRRRAYPVFSEFNPQIYYEKEKAVEIIQRFSTKNAELFTY